MKRLITVTVLMSLLAGANPASALTLSNVEGEWSNPTGGDPINYLYDQDAGGYGNNQSDQIWWGVDVGNGQSGLGFTGALGGPLVVGEAFQLGQLRHFNQPIEFGTHATAVDLTINLEFSDPSGLDDSFLFTFSINETLNSPTLQDDYIFFPSSFPCETCDIGGTQYTLELLGFGLDADSLEGQFQSPEGGTNRTLLWARITTRPIPAPGALLLGAMGTGLVGWLRRRRAL